MTHYDIALIGSGSANSFPGPELADRSIVQIDRGVGPDGAFGGTCLNVGCIPTKMLVLTADAAIAPAEAARLGVRARLEGVDWPAIRDRIFADRIDPISRGGLAYRAEHEDNANLTLLRGTARFTGPGAMEVELADGTLEQITADTFVLGAGSRPAIPGIDGLAEAAPLTSDTIMRVDELPASLAILGSGVIAVELAHVLSALGVDVTVIARSALLLRREDADIAAAATARLAERCRVVTGFTTAAVRRTADGVRITGTRDGREETIEAQEILVATGRRPNSDLLDAAAGGIGLEDDGRVRVDPYQRVLDPAGRVIEGHWAFGDLSSPHQLKHVANHEQRIVRHNVLHPSDLRRSDTMPVPRGIFGAPQIAAVGLTEAEAREHASREGREIRVARQDYAGIAYGWALEDTTSFAKLIADAETAELLGCHIIGPEATVLIQPLVQAMSLGQSARDIARTQYWIHPALTELVENALLQLTD